MNNFGATLTTSEMLPCQHATDLHLSGVDPVIYGWRAGNHNGDKHQRGFLRSVWPQDVHMIYHRYCK